MLMKARVSGQGWRLAGLLAVLLLAWGAVLAQEDSATDLERVREGVEAPAFRLSDTRGTEVTLGEFRNRRMVLLVFFRGHW